MPSSVVAEFLVEIERRFGSHTQMYLRVSGRLCATTAVETRRSAFAGRQLVEASPLPSCSEVERRQAGIDLIAAPSRRG